MRLVGVFLWMGTGLLAACAAGPTSCTSDLDCGPSDYCEHGADTLRGYCRPSYQRPLPAADGGAEEDGGAPEVDAGTPAGQDGGSFDGGAAQDGGTPFD